MSADARLRTDLVGLAVAIASLADRIDRLERLAEVDAHQFTPDEEAAMERFELAAERHQPVMRGPDH